MARRHIKYSGEHVGNTNTGWTSLIRVPVADNTQVSVNFFVAGSTLDTFWSGGTATYLATARRADALTPAWEITIAQEGLAGSAFGYGQHFRIVGHADTGLYEIQLQVRAHDPSGAARTTYWVAEAETLVCDSAIS